MKHFKNWYMLIVAIICVGLLTGCGGKETAETLLEAVEENIESVDSFKGTMSMGIEMAAEQDGYSMDVATGMNLNMEVTEGPNAFHYTGKMEMNLFDVSMEIEAYGVEEDGRFVTYTGADGFWGRTEGSLEDAEMSLSNSLSLEAFAKDTKLVLEDETEEFDGKDVYVLTASISEEDFRNAMSNSAGAVAADMFESLDVDFSGFSMDVAIKIYKDSKLPASISMSVPTDELMSIEQDGATLTLSELAYSVEFLEYNTVDTIEVPDEVLANAEGFVAEDDFSEESIGLKLDENSNYILTDYEETVEFSIANLDGYAISEYADSTYLDYYPMQDNDDFYSNISYSVTLLDEFWGMEDIAELHAVDEGFYSEEDGYHDVQISDEKILNVNGLEVHYIMVRFGFEHSTWDTQIYAWADMGNNSAIECTLYGTTEVEGERTVDESHLKMAFEAIQ